ncbi:phosphoribosyltransferase family protein [Thalassotalea sp. Y01]|uniref:ComF family protein n=1 Tax=Thalassotalea sp. Y01 TaxID=2729613 RepID=UPI00145C5EEA|nr:phosphoribosyltransferase family protein [Thalassotalea sp. Y01]NMP16099.1 ComF family protein [Thalassotalea sp. Y01]
MKTITNAIATLKHTVSGAFSQDYHCDLCHQASHNQPLLCIDCQQTLAAFDWSHCSNNLLHTPAIARYLSHQHYEALIAVAPHMRPFSDWIAQLKYARRFELATMLAHLMYQQIQATNVTADIMLPVPLSYARLRWRQFNQTVLLAKALAKYSAISCDYHYLRRQQSVRRQVGKSGAQRRRALSKAFYVTGGDMQLKGKHVLLIDDVVTTGTTVNTIAKLLKKHGAARVTVLSISVALYGNALSAQPK